MRRGGSGQGVLVVAAAVGQRPVHVEHQRVVGALAVGVGEAVHAGVAAADDHHALAGGGDLALGRAAALAALGAGHARLRW